MFICKKCPFQIRHFYKLISHYRFVHSHEHGFSLSCPADSCEKEYSNIDSLLKHVKRKHKNFHHTHLAKFKEKNRQADILESLVEVDEEIDSAENDQSLDVDLLGNIPDINFCRKICIFLLTLREKYKLPAVVIPDIVHEFISMVCHHQAQFSGLVTEFSRDYQLDEVQTNALKSILQQQSDVENALGCLDSSYKVNKYVREHFNYIKPVEFRPNRNERETCQYIPILDTLKNMLSHNDVFSYVINSHKSDDGLLRDFCDGELAQTNRLFQRHPNALQIMLFFDEFTAANPIGHQVKNYKIAGFYMLLGNLPPKLRSQLYVIQLVMLCMSSSIKVNGFEAVMEPLIHDLHTLETEGIVVSKPDGDHTLNGTISVVVADNLGAHGVGGYMEAFNTLRNCRFCLVTKANMQTIFESDRFNIRTVQMYNEQVRLVQADPTLATVYGIKTNSSLNQLDYFHVVNGMPSDLAHDLFEGVVPEIMTNVIRNCVAEGYFSLSDLNERIVSFQFSDVDKSNKPSKVSQVLSKLKIRQSAAQMWCFVRHLPLLVGEKVPLNDPNWETLLCLRDLLFYVCAPGLDRGHILSMADVIEEFHQSYRQNFPDETVKPKFHYTLHYPRLTQLFGPLIHLQTIRFEGKHNYFKELVYRTKNKKNICKTLAERHQYYQCTYNVSENFLSNNGQFESSGGSAVPICLLDNDFQRLLLGIHNGEEIFICKSISVSGISYWQGTCVIKGLQGFLFEFSKINQCAIINGVPYLFCRKMRTVDFDRHFHGFIVSEMAQLELVKVSDLQDPNPYGLYNHPTHHGQIVVVKYKVVF